MPFNIPTINIAPYLADPNSAAAAQVVADVREACVTTGFFSLVGHGVPQELQQSMLRGCKKLFALPLETKRVLRPPGPLLNRGYELIGTQVLQPGARPDLKEGYFIGQHVPYTDERAKRHPLLVGENIFPAELPDADLRLPAEAYYLAVRRLGCTVLTILAKGLPYGEDVFAEFMDNDPLCNLRLLHYPPQTNVTEGDNNNGNDNGNPPQLGAGAHTDFGAITLLYQDTAGGLEVLDQATGTWVGVPPDPAAYVVNVGDMLSMWTQNTYKSNMHRVINRSQTDRYSLPFFFDGNLDARLAPLDGSSAAVPADSSGHNAVLTAEQHILARVGASFGLAAYAGPGPAVVAAAATPAAA
ncbi:2og-Fe oxygenase family protein [Niveomyces insectorum RCEF 264]|uniref:2og-Fe oxygenase family protein n=1 Tax=Niveomyces insectorum RCEF 264 TaxID=1081102 RepID=A0A162J1Y8_9HYPO|nr:2og-Fe oxygenase family protein [Niveomyces insectorum RCEF 264]